MSGSTPDIVPTTPEPVVILPRKPLLLTPVGIDASGAGAVCEGDSCSF